MRRAKAEVVSVARHDQGQSVDSTFGPGLEAAEGKLQLTGWTCKRRVVIGLNNGSSSGPKENLLTLRYRILKFDAIKRFSLVESDKSENLER